MVSLRAIDFGQAAVEGIANAVGGGIQRMAWERENMGFLITGGMIVGGLLGKSMFPARSLLGIAADAAFESGATVAGWVGAERAFDLQGAATSPPALQPGIMRRGLRAGSHPNPGAYANSNRPGVAVSGRNPQTGEEILGSRV